MSTTHKSYTIVVRQGHTEDPVETLEGPHAHEKAIRYSEILAQKNKVTVWVVNDEDEVIAVVNEKGLMGSEDDRRSPET